ncbi:hypothetical protein CZ771_04070 [Actinomycetales bacterium JB111]|nr:hypothetical protein CZ771_04070 [Actinomycetales bacterium JB111]
MADRALRGMKIGAYSMESEEGVEFAERVRITFDCVDGHVFTVPFAVEAEIPALWDCPECGKESLRRNAERPEPTKPARKVRTHWDMLLERRSIEELEVLLDERLELLRSGQLRRRSA